MYILFKNRNLTNYIQRIYSNKEEMDRESKLIDAKLKSSVVGCFLHFVLSFYLLFPLYFICFFYFTFILFSPFFLCMLGFCSFVLNCLVGMFCCCVFFFLFRFFFHVGCEIWFNKIIEILFRYTVELQILTTDTNLTVVPVF